MSAAAPARVLVPFALALATLTLAPGVGGCRREVAPTPSTPATPARDLVSTTLDPVLSPPGRLAELRAIADVRARGDRVYALVYEADPRTPKRPPTMTLDAYKAKLAAYPRTVTVPDWIARIGMSGNATNELVRFYFDLEPDGVLPVVERLTDALNAAHVPFALKVPDTFEAMKRSSTGVLYVERKDLATARGAVLDVARAEPAAFAEEITPFTKPLARGVGVAAEPPASGMPATRPAHSFGTVCADVVAEAIGDAPADALAPAVEDAVRARFRRYGIDPDRPWDLLRSDRL